MTKIKRQRIADWLNRLPQGRWWWNYGTSIYNSFALMVSDEAGTEWNEKARAVIDLTGNHRLKTIEPSEWCVGRAKTITTMEFIEAAPRLVKRLLEACDELEADLDKSKAAYVELENKARVAMYARASSEQDLTTKAIALAHEMTNLSPTQQGFFNAMTGTSTERALRNSLSAVEGKLAETNRALLEANTRAAKAEERAASAEEAIGLAYAHGNQIAKEELIGGVRMSALNREFMDKYVPKSMGGST